MMYDGIGSAGQSRKGVFLMNNAGKFGSSYVKNKKLDLILYHIKSEFHIYQWPKDRKKFKLAEEKRGIILMCGAHKRILL